MIKGPSVLLLLSALTILVTFSFGEEETILYPADNTSPAYFQGDASKPGDHLFERFVLAAFLALVGVGGISFYLWRKGKFPLSPMHKSGRLNLSETKMLGNKQFLVVVEYENQKLLLGVGPGLITHLCYLEPPEAGEEFISPKLARNQ